MKYLVLILTLGFGVVSCGGGGGSSNPQGEDIGQNETDNDSDTPTGEENPEGEDTDTENDQDSLAVINMAGTWTITSIVDESECGEGTYTERQTLLIEQDDNQLRVLDSENNLFTGEINDNIVEWSGSYSEDGGETRLELQAEINDSGNSLTGTSTFDFVHDEFSCSGSTTFDGERTQASDPDEDSSGGENTDGQNGSDGLELAALTGDWPNYLGGADADYATSVAVDSEGNTFFGGTTSSSYFLWQQGDDILQSSSLFEDTFILKFDAEREPLWAKTLDTGAGLIGMVVDNQGNLLVQGYETVIKLSPEGERLWSVDFSDTWGAVPFSPETSKATLESGSAQLIQTTSIGEVIVAGTTTEAGAAENGFQTERPGRRNGFIAKLSQDGDLVWSTYLGSSLSDRISAISVGPGNTVYVTGTTDSLNWPQSSFEPHMPNEVNRISGRTCFVAAVSTGGDFIWSNFIGGGLAESPLTTDSTISLSDKCLAIEHDLNDNLYITGTTTSMGENETGWTFGGYQTSPSEFDGRSSDGFVLLMKDDGRTIVWSTYFGNGGGANEGLALAGRGVPGVYVTGFTESGAWAEGGFDTVYNGRGDGFYLKLSASGAHEYSSYLGGKSADEARALVLDPANNPIIVGHTNSGLWLPGDDPENLEGQDRDYEGSSDAFILWRLPSD